MKERLDYIDRAKGILIILMVIGHIWQAGYVHEMIYVFHMPAFFVISGMLMRYTEAYTKNFTFFLKRRIFSYSIPFILAEVLGVLTDIVRHGVTLNIKGYVYNTLILDYNDPNMWFLVSLFCIEMFFVMLKKIVKDDRLVCLICLCCVLASRFVSSDSAYIATLLVSAKYLLYFIIGFYRSEIFQKNNWYVTAAAIAVVLVIAALFGKRADGNISVANCGFFLGALCGTYAVLQMGKLQISPKINKMLSTVGMNTIIIYTTHRFIYAAFGQALGVTDYAATPVGLGILLLVAVVALEIPTICIINRWLPFLAGKEKRLVEVK